MKNYVIEKSSYNHWQQLDPIYKEFNYVLTSDEKRFDNFRVNIVDVDDLPDCTDVDPKERNLVVHTMQIFNNKSEIDTDLKQALGSIYENIAKLPGIEGCDAFFHSPQTWVPPHTHEPWRPDYDPTPHYNIYLPLLVPGKNVEESGLKVGELTYQIEQGVPMIFDGNVPHSSWNYKDEWCYGIIFDISKKFFDKEIPYENFYS